jgi:hypothetical protein
MRPAQWRTFVIAAIVCLGVAGSALAQCGPMDVVFVVDVTGSMGGAIDNVKKDLPGIITQIQTASSGDFRLGLVKFDNTVIVVNDMASGNVDAVKAGINAMSAGGGGDEPEASDEAVRTVVNSLKAADRTSGNQVGDFAATFRPEATKVIILITDARPAGFDDKFDNSDETDVQTISTQAAAKGIHISAIFVPTPAASSFGVTDTVARIMQSYASLSAGIYLKANPDGTGTSSAINDIIASCGGGAGTGGISLILDPNEIILSNGESFDVTATNYLPGDTKTLVYGSSGLPEDSTVTFTKVANPSVKGTDQRTVRVTIGPDTPAGVYLLNVTAGHTDQAAVQSNFVLVNVDCVPPMILGVAGNQPSNTTTGTNGTATLSVKPVGSLGLRYQWYRGHSGSTAFPISGATSATVTTPAVTTPTEFWVRVSNACGSRDSGTAVVTPR